MSSASSEGCSRRISSVVMPSATMATTVATGIRRPRMQGTPPILSAATVIRGNRIILASGGLGDPASLILGRPTRPRKARTRAVGRSRSHKRPVAMRGLSVPSPRRAAKRQLGASHTWMGYCIESPTLVTSGIYAYLCHPLYAGVYLFEVGALCTFAPRISALLPWTATLAIVCLAYAMSFNAAMAAWETRRMARMFRRGVRALLRAGAGVRSRAQVRSPRDSDRDLNAE